MTKIFTKYTPMFLVSNVLLLEVGQSLLSKDENQVKALSMPVANGVPFTAFEVLTLLFSLLLVASIFFLWKDIN